jgi:hypothetical protein
MDGAADSPMPNHVTLHNRLRDRVRHMRVKVPAKAHGHCGADALICKMCGASQLHLKLLCCSPRSIDFYPASVLPVARSQVTSLKEGEVRMTVRQLAPDYVHALLRCGQACCLDLSREYCCVVHTCHCTGITFETNNRRETACLTD